MLQPSRTKRSSRAPSTTASRSPSKPPQPLKPGLERPALPVELDVVEGAQRRADQRPALAADGVGDVEAVGGSDVVDRRRVHRARIIARRLTGCASRACPELEEGRCSAREVEDEWGDTPHALRRAPSAAPPP